MSFEQLPPKEPGEYKRHSSTPRRRSRSGEYKPNSNQQNGSSTMKLAQGLGWFSLGLGLAELLAPRAVAKVAGLQGAHTGLIRLYGLREIASGVGIFSQRKPAEAVWSRVAGDAIDLASLGSAFAAPGAKKGRLAFATASVLGVTALDVMCAQQLSSSNGSHNREVEVTRSVVINAPAEQLYNYWHNFEQLPSFMKHLESVTATGDRRSHWIAKAPGGTTVEWDAEVTEDEPNHRIAWRSDQNADVYNSGSVTFEPAVGGRGTVVRVEMRYEPPFGWLGVTLAKLFGEEPEQQVSEDLRRFKQVIETGEVVLSEATLFGIGYTEQRPAQAPGDEELNKEMQRRAAGAR